MNTASSCVDVWELKCSLNVNFRLSFHRNKSVFVILLELTNTCTGTEDTNHVKLLERNLLKYIKLHLHFFAMIQ